MKERVAQAKAPREPGRVGTGGGSGANMAPELRTRAVMG